jgi:hypothetical protein
MFNLPWRKAPAEPKTGGTFGGADPLPFHLPTKEADLLETIADRLDAMCADLGCVYERELLENQVVIALAWETGPRAGERVVGRGPTTADAFYALSNKVY